MEEVAYLKNIEKGRSIVVCSFWDDNMSFLTYTGFMIYTLPVVICDSSCTQT